ncbi:uncharacterized protein LOC118438278 [Folsomia candida]|uniref:uncharacterized protein LOC118438278 n=1 Tax=Folsomia candida TaxID=158441 RepID=UPI001604D61D|nr:uncharacterized protein LOC118438278 [Folsomia candida]
MSAAMKAEIDQAAAQLENCDFVTEVNEVAMKVLLNPLILENVFGFLDTLTLKSIRLVCTVWTDVGTTILGKQGRLRFSTPRTNPAELTSFNHDLAKNMHIYFDTNLSCGLDDSCTCPETLTNLPTKFVMILPEISDKLETLDFYRVDTLEPLQKLWSTYHFPHLTRISIIAMGPHLDKRAPPPEMTQFRLLPNLKVFHLNISPGCEKNVAKSLMSTFCQNLVNAAPNLEDFDLDATTFCDLTGCRKLKKLRVIYYSTGRFQFKLSEMMKMIESCRISLESLILDLIGNDINPTELDLNLPKLTHLMLNAPDGRIINDSLNITKLPKLTHFSISNIHTNILQCDISALIKHYYLRHKGITSLDVWCDYYPDRAGQAAERLADLFPAVKQLNLALGLRKVGDSDQYFLALREMMHSFSDWDLTCGKVEFAIWCGVVSEISSAQLVIAVLGGMAGWRGLTNMSLKFIAGPLPHRPELRLLDEMRDALLSCRTIRSMDFTGFLMEEETKDNFQAFIREHNLPISITIDN